jgi:RsmE family RNA methyltransferase
VNLLLVEPAELRADGTCVLDGRRARHLRDVLGARPGARVRAGVIGGGIGTAEVIADDGVALVLRVAVDAARAPARDVELVVAVPRPKAIARAIEIAASFGVARVELTNAWRVDKSYLASPKLAADALAIAARVGAEQGMTTRVPDVRVWSRFVALVDARFAIDPHETRLVAHPGAPPIEGAALGDGTTIVAIGPERGWIDRELDTLVARGFQPVSLGAPVLRVEAAIAAALAELALLHRIEQASPSA